MRYQAAHSGSQMSSISILGTCLGSQGNGFGEDALSQVWRKGLLCNYVHWTMYELLQLLLESYQVQK